jgi:hypothetical protein
MEVIRIFVRIGTDTSPPVVDAATPANAPRGYPLHRRLVQSSPEREDLRDPRGWLWSPTPLKAAAGPSAVMRCVDRLGGSDTLEHILAERLGR